MNWEKSYVKNYWYTLIVIIQLKQLVYTNNLTTNYQGFTTFFSTVTNCFATL